MAQVIKLICDSCEDTDDVENVRFAYEGQAYEFDLCKKDADEFAKAMSRWVSDARAVGVSRGRPLAVSTTVDDRDYDPAVVRAWAKSADIEVSAKGRVSADVVAKWKEAGSPAAF